MATTPQDLDTAGRRNVGAAQIAAAVGGLLLVLFVIWIVFLRPAPEDADTPAAVPAPATSPEDAEEIEDDDAEADTRRNPVETFEVFAPKDPFDPLISASAGADGSGADATADGGATGTVNGTTADGTGTTTTDGTGTTTTDGTGTTTTTTSGGGGGGGENIDGHRVRVIDVYREGGSRRAQIQVDGTVYTVDEGERFATNFRLMSTSGRCATMLFGDDQFTLCEGEEILK